MRAANEFQNMCVVVLNKPQIKGETKLRATVRRREHVKWAIADFKEIVEFVARAAGIKFLSAHMAAAMRVLNERP